MPNAVSASTLDAPEWANLFTVASVERSKLPEAGEQEQWWKYVLTDGNSTIVGQRKGSLKEVKAHAADCVEKLNARRLGKSAIRPSSPRGNGAKKKSTG